MSDQTLALNHIYTRDYDPVVDDALSRSLHGYLARTKWLAYVLVNGTQTLLQVSSCQMTAFSPSNQLSADTRTKWKGSFYPQWKDHRRSRRRSESSRQDPWSYEQDPTPA